MSSTTPPTENEADIMIRQFRAKNFGIDPAAKLIDLEIDFWQDPTDELQPTAPPRLGYFASLIERGRHQLAVGLPGLFKHI